MPRWTIMGYGNDRRRNFEEQYRNQPTVVRAEFRAIVNGLRDQPREAWTRPAGYDQLPGRFRELGKLLIKVPNVQHRPLGFVWPAKMVFVFLIWTTERDRKFDPPNARETALKRRIQILKGGAMAHEFDY